MIRYDENTAVVIETISRYGYSQHAIDWSNNCFMQLKLWHETRKIQIFSRDNAYDWVNGESVHIRYKRFYQSTIERLIDVYETGAVRRIYLSFYSRILPLTFTKARDSYLSSIINCSERQIGNIRNACNRFLGFLHITPVSKF